MARRHTTLLVCIACTLCGAIAEDRAPRDASGFWSYRPIERPAVPYVSRVDWDSKGQRDWSRNPVDAFIAAERQKQGLRPSLPAEPAVLLRRLYLDLIGLPPTRQELREFLTDPSDLAYERTVDRLLASPQYGERWGRHWMDVWRYSDWYGSRAGNEIRYSQRHIWRWRDWIIDSLNADKGYDQMIREMLAGDELAPADPKVTRATGFIGRNWYKYDRNVWMFDLVEHTSAALLGLTLKCARCHEHKFDPIAQQDYYRFRAFFEPHDVRTDPLSGRTGTEKDAQLGLVLQDGVSRVYDKQLEVPTYVFTRGDERYPDEKQPCAPGVPVAFGFDSIEIQPVSLPFESYAPALRESFVAEKIDAAKAAVMGSEAGVADASAALVAAERSLAAFIDREASGLAQPAPPAGTAAPSRDDVELALKMAQRGMIAAEQRGKTARAEFASLEARVAADWAKATEASDVASLARTAAAAERVSRLAQAELEAIQTEQAVFAARASCRAAAGTVNGSTQKALADAEAKLAAARKALATARAAATKDAAYTPIGPLFPKSSTGRRSALARWIVDRRNPRTARVAANHIWLRHFGHAIVPTVANFGMNGSQPSHPELLDWLAAELMDHNWSMKHLHRLLVTSNTYRMASSDGATSNNLEVDPDNRFLWRMNSRRMESETVRDSLLSASGQLDMTLGGREIEESRGLDCRRRSLYFRSTPNEKMAFLEVFDQANPNECYRRQESVVPQQSLALENSALALNQARLLARRVSAEVGAADSPACVAAFIEAAFEHVLARPPSQDEVATCARFLSRHTALVRDGPKTLFPESGDVAAAPPAQDPHQHARENLVHVLFNHNDFVTIR